MKKYATLIFDADETLFDFKKSERIAFDQTSDDFKLPSNYFSIYTAINTSIWKEFEQGEITQKELKVERFKRLADATEISFNAEDFANRFMKHLANASYIYPESHQILTQLKKHYKIAILTNGLKGVQTKRIGASEIAHLFDALIISEEVGYAKPDPRIFKLTLERVNTSDPSSALIIGDSLTSDIQGGLNSGIDTCWYNPEKKVNHASITPTYEIHQLSQLISLLNT